MDLRTTYGLLGVGPGKQVLGCWAFWLYDMIPDIFERHLGLGLMYSKDRGEMRRTHMNPLWLD